MQAPCPKGYASQVRWAATYPTEFTETSHSDKRFDQKSNRSDLVLSGLGDEWKSDRKKVGKKFAGHVDSA
jgi:hypothetical protein